MFQTTNQPLFHQADFSFLGSLSLLDPDKKKLPIFPRFRPWPALMQAVMKGVKRSVGMPKPFRGASFVLLPGFSFGFFRLV